RRTLWACRLPLATAKANLRGHNRPEHWLLPARPIRALDDVAEAAPRNDEPGKRCNERRQQAMRKCGRSNPAADGDRKRVEYRAGGVRDEAPNGVDRLHAVLRPGCTRARPQC